MPDLAHFHERLFGVRDEDPRAEKLFEAFAKHGCRGFNSEDQSLADLKTVTTLALYMVKESLHGNNEPVVIIVPAAWYTWAVAKLKVIATALIGVRKRKPEGVQAIRDAFSMIRVTHKPRLVPETAAWLLLGYTTSSPIPDWMRDRLLTV